MADRRKKRSAALLRPGRADPLQLVVRRHLSQEAGEYTNRSVPGIEGSEINDNPFAPVSKFAVDLVGEMGDRTRVLGCNSPLRALRGSGRMRSMKSSPR